MKRKKLLKVLAGWLDKDAPKSLDKRKELEQLLKKLKEKEAKLKNKLQQEDNKRKRKQLKMELNIVRVQRAKGVHILQGLKDCY